MGTCIVSYGAVKTKEQHSSGASVVFLKTSLSQVPHVLGEPKAGMDNSFALPGVGVLLFLLMCFQPKFLHVYAKGSQWRPVALPPLLAWVLPISHCLVKG